MKVYLHMRAVIVNNYWLVEGLADAQIMGAYATREAAKNAAKAKNPKLRTYKHYVKMINVKEE